MQVWLEVIPAYGAGYRGTKEYLPNTYVVSQEKITYVSKFCYSFENAIVNLIPKRHSHLGDVANSNR